MGNYRATSDKLGRVITHNFTNVGHKISAANNRKEDWDLQEYLLAGIIWGLSASRIEH